MSHFVLSEVLTLEEAAAYLRLPLETIERQASQGQIPGRRIEETWRFLKSAIDDWLRAQDSRAILMQQSGALAGDEYADELLAMIYRDRQRSESNDEEAP
jgi:excisionase family DNA binding protein